MVRRQSIQRAALVIMVLALAAGSAAYAQTPVAQNRVAQQVVIGGLRVDAAYVLAAGGGVQSYTCPTPQQYITPDGASQGWACFDPTTGVWLLSALPPQQAAPAPAPVVVQQVVQQPVYQPPVVYAVAQPTIIYRNYPRYIYAAPIYPGYPRVYYSSSAIIGAATINAAGRIAAAVIETSRFHDDHRTNRVVGGHRR
ncbi:MAG TPA: hypothetical protein VK210_08295 [Terriglobia bacterium]|nr:hypothetical protein [Terriglobia bacterium]